MLHKHIEINVKSLGCDGTFYRSPSNNCKKAKILETSWSQADHKVGKAYGHFP